MGKEVFFEQKLSACVAQKYFNARGKYSMGSCTYAVWNMTTSRIHSLLPVNKYTFSGQ